MDSAKKATSRHANQEVQEEEDHEEEELVYTGAQILAGSLDKHLHSFAGVVVSNSSNGDKVNGRQKQQEDILGELRGRAVLGIFNLGDDIQGYDNRKHTHELENCWVGRNTSGLVSDDGPFVVALKGQQDETEGDLLWKLLRQPIISIAHVCVANGLVEQALHRDGVTAKELLYSTARQHICRALNLWSCNPSGLLALANLTRMGVIDNSRAFCDVNDSYDCQAMLWRACGVS